MPGSSHVTVLYPIISTQWMVPWSTALSAASASHYFVLLNSFHSLFLSPTSFIPSNGERRRWKESSQRNHRRGEWVYQTLSWHTGVGVKHKGLNKNGLYTFWSDQRTSVLLWKLFVQSLMAIQSCLSSSNYLFVRFKGRFFSTKPSIVLSANSTHIKPSVNLKIGEV